LEGIKTQKEVPPGPTTENKAGWQDVTLTVDVMFVDGIGFLVITSRNIKFTTDEYVPNQS
jgi:hypothetical protein